MVAKRPVSPEQMKTEQRQRNRNGRLRFEESSPEVCRLVLDRYRKGSTTAQAICGLKISPGTARRLARNAHIKIKRAPRGPRTPKPPSARNRLIAQFIGEGCTLQATGAFFGLTRERVREIIERQGVHVVPANGAGRDWPAWESAAAYIACGGSVEEAAREAAVVQASVRFICNALGVALP